MLVGIVNLKDIETVCLYFLAEEALMHFNLRKCRQEGLQFVLIKM